MTHPQRGVVISILLEKYIIFVINEVKSVKKKHYFSQKPWRSHGEWG
jgi:hypothetical protein